MKMVDEEASEGNSKVSGEVEQSNVKDEVKQGEETDSLCPLLLTTIFPLFKGYTAVLNKLFKPLTFQILKSSSFR